MKFNRQTNISREGWYYLLVVILVFGGAMLREVNLLLMLAGMLAGPLLFSWRIVRLSLRGLVVERKVPHGVCAGDLLVASVHLKNTRRRFGSWGVVVEEQIQREGSGRRERAIRPNVLYPYVRAGESRKGGYRGRLVRRGLYRLGPMRVSTRFPFGLLCRTITTDETATLTVLPRQGQLTQRWSARRREAFAGAHRRERRHGLEGDFFGTREWRSGDSRRWIHWRSSARRGALVVRQFEQPRNQDLALLVDLWQPKKPAPEQLDNVELAVSFAATVVADLCRKGGSNLWLGTTGQETQAMRGPTSAILLNDAMQHLALAEAHRDDGLPELLKTALTEIDPGTEVVLVSTRPVDLADTERFAALWSDPNSRSLVRRIRCIDTSSEELDDYFQVE